jgi:hypothetical protein
MVLSQRQSTVASRWGLLIPLSLTSLPPQQVSLWAEADAPGLVQPIHHVLPHFGIC